MRGEQGPWPPTDFSTRLRELREQAGLTQKQLAERVPCGQSTIAKLEQNLQGPHWALVLLLAKALGCTPNDFLRGDNRPHRHSKRKEDRG